MPDCQQYWGKYAKPGPILLGLRVVIRVPEWFWRGPITNLLRPAGRPVDAKGVNGFASEWLAKWCEEYHLRKTPVPLDRRIALGRLVPRPARGEVSLRIRADLDGSVAEATFGRAVGARFGANHAGAQLALREALVMGLDELRRQADAEAASMESARPGEADKA